MFQRRSPSEVLAAHSASDFATWEYVLRELWNEPDRECYYLAQIAHQIYLFRIMLLGVPDKGEPLPFEKFLMKFTYGPKDKVKESGLGDKVQVDEHGKPILDMEHVRQIERVIFGSVGLDKDGRVKPKGKVKTVAPKPDVRKRPNRAPMVRRNKT